VLKIVGWFMVFNATFNNISVILWLSVLVVAETGVPGENLSQVTDKLNVLKSYMIICPNHLKWDYQLRNFGETTLL